MGLVVFEMSHPAWLDPQTKPYPMTANPKTKVLKPAPSIGSLYKLCLLHRHCNRMILLRWPWPNTFEACMEVSQTISYTQLSRAKSSCISQAPKRYFYFNELHIAKVGAWKTASSTCGSWCCWRPTPPRSSSALMHPYMQFSEAYKRMT